MFEFILFQYSLTKFEQIHLLRVFFLTYHHKKVVLRITLDWVL